MTRFFGISSSTSAGSNSSVAMMYAAPIGMILRLNHGGGMGSVKTIVNPLVAITNDVLGFLNFAESTPELVETWKSPLA